MFRTENDLWRVLLPIVEAAVQDFAGLKVKRAYQGSTQAEGKAPRLLLYRAGSRRVGAQGLRYCRTDEALREQSVWRKEDTFQAFALVDRTAKDAGYTALDVLETLAANLQGEEALAALRREGLGILRISEIIETPYEDAADNWRISVSIKFILTYAQVAEREVPALSGVEGRVRSLQE